jgi:hypothetical protein
MALVSQVIAVRPLTDGLTRLQWLTAFIPSLDGSLICVSISQHGARRFRRLTSWFTVVGATLVLGGSQVLAGLSGVNVYAACFIVSN